MKDEASQTLLEGAARLIEAQRTLSLAIADDEGPWSAPVYYLFDRGYFCFFSNSESRHAAIGPGARCAASLYRDGDDWRAIEGIQMQGHIELVPASRAAAVYARYLKRYPSVIHLLGGSRVQLSVFLERFRARLYAFVPEKSFYLNNRLGFGKRQAFAMTDLGGPDQGAD